LDEAVVLFKPSGFWNRLLTIAYCKTYWFSESIQSKVLNEASTILKVIALQST
jgi:hypothetical protein